MARKKEPEKPANHERWLVSYGDFITLLFAVFVTLYAMSQVDKKKWKRWLLRTDRPSVSPLVPRKGKWR